VCLCVHVCVGVCVSEYVYECVSMSLFVRACVCVCVEGRVMGVVFGYEGASLSGCGGIDVAAKTLEGHGVIARRVRDCG